MTYTAIVNTSGGYVTVVDENQSRKAIAVDGKPTQAYVQGDEVHITLESGHIDVVSASTSALIRRVLI